MDHLFGSPGFPDSNQDAMQDQDSGCGSDMKDLGNLSLSLGLDCGSLLVDHRVRGESVDLM